MRNSLLRAFAEASDSMRSIQEAVRAWQQQMGRTVAGFDQIAGAMEEVRRLQEDIFRDWDSLVEPIEGPPGDPMPVDEAFAEMMGITKEELARKVEEHKRKKKALGWE